MAKKENRFLGTPRAGVQDLLRLYTHNFEFETDDDRSNSLLTLNSSLNFKYKVTAGGCHCLPCCKSKPIHVSVWFFTGFLHKRDEIPDQASDSVH